MNTSDLTRREQVYEYLKEHIGQWVDGPDLANEEVGGSEGLKRLRELRAEGYPIGQRRHPDESRDIWQYQLIANVKVKPKPIDPSIVAEAEKIDEAVVGVIRKLTFGTHVICPSCRNKGVRAQAECRQCNGKGYVEAS